ncbi:MAG: tol-pal system-associated acyl-CoA thioesterase [Paracoccaceae bacterium]
MTAPASECHVWPIRVYYEDTDLAGLVYYANYLRFIERARSEWVRGLGIDQVALKAAGIVFAVRRVEADYLSPARYDDLLEVTTALVQATAARMVVDQAVTRDGTVLFTARVTIVALDGAGRPTRLPADLRARLRDLGREGVTPRPPAR